MWNRRTAWQDALMHVAASRSVPPSPAMWLAALALDDAGTQPEDLLGCVTVWLTPVPGLQIGLQHLVETVYGVDAVGSGDTVPRGGLMVLPYTRSYPNWVVARAAADASAVVIAGAAADVEPTSAIESAEEAFVVADTFGCAAVSTLVLAVTGYEPDLPEDMPKLPFADLVGAVRVGSDMPDCETRIKRLIEARHAADAEKAKASAVVVAEAQPLGQAAASVVRKLSEMTGFGDAGAWGLQLAEDLRAYGEGKLAWSEVDRGVLLSGPPGSGKTTFAKSLSLEAGVELVSSGYGDLANGGSHDIAKSMTKKFDLWREKAKQRPIIVLIDEIDTLGVRGNNAHNDSYWGGVINAMLAFLDGATPRDGIVVIGATNHPNNVDPALIRPGRLDRHVELPYPGPQAMAGIVRLHLGPAAVIDEAELAQAARACRGMSPAQVEQVCREARRMARTMFKRFVCADDVSLVIGARRLADLQRPGAREVDRRVAIHEAAHAIAMLQSSSDVLTRVDMEAAQTWSTGKQLLTLPEVEQRLVVLLAGLAAEQALLGGHATGVSADLREATGTATAAHAAWGMGALGYRVLSMEDAVADATVTAAVDAILDAAHARARAMVEESRDAIERLADRLQRDRYLDADEVREIVEAGPVHRRRP